MNVKFLYHFFLFFGDLTLAHNHRKVPIRKEIETYKTKMYTKLESTLFRRKKKNDKLLSFILNVINISVRQYKHERVVIKHFAKLTKKSFKNISQYGIKDISQSDCFP